MDDAWRPTPADIVATADSTFPPSPPDPVQRCADAKTWVEVQMLDGNGDPVAGQAYVVVTPDQVRHEGNLDANGLVRIDGLDPGTCQISFPGLDRSSWQRL